MTAAPDPSPAPAASGFRPARVVAVQDDLVTIAMDPERPRPIIKNEVVYICPRQRDGGRQERLKAEVLRVHGSTAAAQVFESTRGVGIGDPVEQTGALLSVSLGPGLLGQVYDGLQNPLAGLAAGYGTFLPRGAAVPPLDTEAIWSFQPSARMGARLRAGDVIGTVQEGRFTHKIMVPFDQPGTVRLDWIQQGPCTLETVVARIVDDRGQAHSLTLVQRWPVRRPLTERLLQSRSSERLYPEEPLITTQRIIDTFLPIARGGTGCIPGPFGAGKTVLQNLISRYSDVDIVLVVACGERAGEVVETITEFPKLTDPKSGGSLMDRTIIICNTSSMPVAAREASIYTGLTLGEYYRQMGCNVLLIADSTSRWAQAMRETSGRLEEIPGEEAFPAYLDSAIKGVYERAGLIRTNDGSVGSLTMIGTVSPAGGNFEEPVTQSTLSTVKAFLGLSAERAYKRCYPAVDLLLSWSRYGAQLEGWFNRHMGSAWLPRVRQLTALVQRADAVQQMIQVTGEDGVSLEDLLLVEQARFLDMVYLQQDAFDPVDASCPLERQRRALDLVWDLIHRPYRFADHAAVRATFTRLTGLCRNLNDTEEDSPAHRALREQIEAVAAAAC